MSADRHRRGGVRRRARRSTRLGGVLAARRVPRRVTRGRTNEHVPEAVPRIRRRSQLRHPRRASPRPDLAARSSAAGTSAARPAREVTREDCPSTARSGLGRRQPRELAFSTARALDRPNEQNTASCDGHRRPQRSSSVRGASIDRFNVTCSAQHAHSIGVDECVIPQHRNKAAPSVWTRVAAAAVERVFAPCQGLDAKAG